MFAYHLEELFKKNSPSIVLEGIKDNIARNVGDMLATCLKSWLVSADFKKELICQTRFFEL